MEQQNITSTPNDVQETNVIEQPNVTSNSIEVQEQSNITAKTSK